jgi:hypothetical protein
MPVNTFNNFLMKSFKNLELALLKGGEQFKGINT